MKKISYISVQPRTLYYAWQVEVMINNFISNGIYPNDIHILIVWNPNDETCDVDSIISWNKIVRKYTNINFYSYEDTRMNPKYVSSIRPHILKKHFKKFPKFKNHCIFYHDCDIVFTKPPDFNELLNDNIWYVSDTNSYLNYDYIKSKEHNVYETMCKIIDIEPNIPIKNNKNSGGAQYLMKNVDWKFWEKVESDSEKLFYEITNLNNKIKSDNPTYHELQIWCADMWAILWNAWKQKIDVKISDKLSFCWPEEHIDCWNKTYIFHNSGNSNGRYFKKFNYIKQIPYDDIKLDYYATDSCSYNYVKEIIKLKNTTCLK